MELYMEWEKVKAVSLKEIWWDFHRQNPDVYDLFCKFTFEAINAGFKNFGAQSVIERLRWETAIVKGNDGFKINNNHAPYYARLFMMDYPQYNGFFRIKKLKGELDA